KVADWRSREGERSQAVDAGKIWSDGNRVGIRAQPKIVPEIFETAAHLHLIFDAVGDRAINAGGRRPPGGRDQAIIELRSIDAVELGRLVVLIDIADWYEVDAG